MPKLSSGRCVGLDRTSPRHALFSGNEAQVLWLIGALRLKIRKPADLRQLCQVLYYDDIPGTTPEETSRRAGLTVLDLESGESDWTKIEIDEFTSWMNENIALKEWLEIEYETIDEKIKTHPLWKSDFMLED